MKVFIAIILSLLPSFIHVPIRRLMGQKIGKKSKLKIGTILISKNVKIGNNVKIGPFSLIRSEDLSVGMNTCIKSFSVISTRIIVLKDYVHIAPLCIINGEFIENSVIEIGNHSRLFPFCWLDTSEGIKIGNQVGVGGHTLIFTHGSWNNYLKGAPISFGPVIIEDNVWLPWRVFVLPNVIIRKNTIVGANSLINKSHPENVLIAGSPAKVVKENITQDLSNDEILNRLNEILEKFKKEIEFRFKTNTNDPNSIYFFEKLCIDEIKKEKTVNLLILVKNKNSAFYTNNTSTNIIDINENIALIKNSNCKLTNEFIAFIRKFGIRLNIEKI